MSATVEQLYAEHGATLAAYPVPVVSFAKAFGITEYKARQLFKMVRFYGPPMLDDDGWPESDAPETILVIGDPHAKPGVSQERFTWLGRAIADINPDHVVCIGDMADMESLSSYDVGTLRFEGRRYKDDIEATREALALINAELGGWSGRKHMTVGNHEHRISRIVNEDPKFDGFMSVDDLGYADAGWEVTPFKSVTSIAGTAFSHYFPSGIMGRPIGGVHPARAMIAKLHTSAVQGHSHLLSYHRESTPLGKDINALSAGCFFEHEEGYAGPANKMWWRGLCLLRDAHDGDFDLETISMASVKRRYA